MRRQALLAAVTVGIAAFALYRATLLPGMDLGDTPSLQTRIGSSLITPRDGYPLYSAIGNLFHWAMPGNPARALNFASAVQGAFACAVIVLVGATLSGSVAAGAAAALLFATSYTFWSQSIIAEVYALHMLFVALTLLLALRWAERPTLGRLAAFFAAYAIGFGNHLSMILLAPAFVIFLLAAAPNGWRSMLAPRVLALAAVCACVGALQYAWNLSALWMLPDPPDGLVDGLQRFWFDVTKADWRETMVLQVPRAMVRDHAAMYAFDLGQQFGWVGPLIALAGLAQLVMTNGRYAALVLTIYVVNLVFAFGYNVGDTHVFYLPSHLMVALLAAPGLVLAGNVLRQRHLVAALLVVYAGARAWRDYPALDRSHDDRPTRVLAALTAGLDDRHSILLTDLNWQIQNGLSYFGKAIAPEVAYERMPAVLLYAPALIADNTAINRDVALTERARSTLIAAYGPLIPSERDPRVTDPFPLGRDPEPAGRQPLRLLHPETHPRSQSRLGRYRPGAGRGHGRQARARAGRRLRRHRGKARTASRSSARVQPPVPPVARSRGSAGEHPHGVVACGRHDPPDGLRPRHRGPPAHADRRARRQLRGVRFVWTRPCARLTRRISSPPSRGTSSRSRAGLAGGPYGPGLQTASLQTSCYR